MRDDRPTDGSPKLSCLSAEKLGRDDGWWRIYDASFPAEEREPREVVLRGVERDVALVSRLSLAGRTAGIASAHLLARSATVFLVYLAMDPRERGRHFGAVLWEFTWQAAVERLRQRGLAPRGMVWEVEMPRSMDSPFAREAKERRLRFFQARGGVLLPLRYIQPPVAGIAVPMGLMFYGSMTIGTDLRQIVEEMYFEKYGAVNGIDGRVLAGLLERMSRPDLGV